MCEEAFIGIMGSLEVGRPPSDVVLLKKAKKNLVFRGKTLFYFKMDNRGR